MRLLLVAALALAAGPAYATYDCKTAEAAMAKALAVMARSGAVDAKAAGMYQESSNVYFSCQKAQQWTLAVAPGKTPNVVTQTQGTGPPQK